MSHGIIAKGSFGEAHFDSYEQVLEYPKIEDIHYLSIDAKYIIESLPSLPPCLQIFHCSNNKLKKLPPLPSTIRIVYARTNKIEEFPMIEHCNELEELNLYDNNIWEVDTLFPSSLQTLDLSFNKLRKINYNKVNPTIASITASYCFLSELPPPHFLSKMTIDHNDIPTYYFARATLQAMTLPTTQHPALRPYVPLVQPPQIYQNNQNVHASSVQTSVNSSLRYILDYKPKHTPSLNFVDDIKAAMRTKRKWYEYFIPSTYCMNEVSFLDAWCKDTTMHSVHGVTYKNLLERVWWIIEDHPHKDAMIDVLKEELLASRFVCFTGRFSRTVNALSGFVEDVQVGISKQEQMQNHITMAIKRSRDKHKDNEEEYVKMAKQEVAGILAEFAVPEADWEAWLDAIE